MAASGRAHLRPPPGFSENPCLNHATCVHRGRGEAGFQSCVDASDANYSTCPNVPGDNRWNILTCRDIPSDMLIDLTSDNARVCTTESSFGKSYQRPSNDSVNVRNIPSIAAANISMHGYISSGCSRDRSDIVMTNSTAHFTMGVSHENACTLSTAPGNVMTETCNCNCNFDMNMFLKNVENSVSRILTEKEMVYHQRLE
jgi:hypothetical protein